MASLNFSFLVTEAHGLEKLEISTYELLNLCPLPYTARMIEGRRGAEESQGE